MRPQDGSAHTTYEYDSSGNRIAERKGEEVRLYAYDAADELGYGGELLPGTSLWRRRTIYGWDGAGRLLSATDQEAGQVRGHESYAYDARGRLAAQTSDDGAGGVWNTQRVHDPEGGLVGLYSATGHAWLDALDDSPDRSTEVPALGPTPGVAGPTVPGVGPSQPITTEPQWVTTPWVEECYEGGSYCITERDRYVWLSTLVAPPVGTPPIPTSVSPVSTPPVNEVPSVSTPAVAPLATPGVDAPDLPPTETPAWDGNVPMPLYMCPDDPNAIVGTPICVDLLGQRRIWSPLAPIPLTPPIATPDVPPFGPTPKVPSQTTPAVPFPDRPDLAPSPPQLSQLSWDPTLSVPQIATMARNHVDTNLLFGQGRELAVNGAQTDVFSQDAYGSSLVTPETEDLVMGSSYDPWGVPTVDTALSARRDVAAGGLDAGNHMPLFGYRGELHQDEIVHLRAREYAPRVGRFTTRDPIAGERGEMGSTNLYPYATSNPVAKDDPLGLNPRSLAAKPKTWCPDNLPASGVAKYLRGGRDPGGAPGQCFREYTKASAREGYSGYRPTKKTFDGITRWVRPDGTGGDDCTVAAERDYYFDFKLACDMHDYSWDLVRAGNLSGKDSVIHKTNGEFLVAMYADCESRHASQTADCRMRAREYHFFAQQRSTWPQQCAYPRKGAC